MKAFHSTVLAAVLLLLRPTEGDAQSTLLWDTNAGTGGVQGGTGNWLGTNFWNNVFNNVSWTNGSNAVFDATPGTVTVNGAVTANQLAFNVSGYTIGGASTLSMGGATPNIFVNNAGHGATISAPLGGSVGFTKAGPGTLTLSGSAANTNTGLATVTDGTLNLSKSGGNAIAGSLTIGDGTGAAASAVVVQGASNQIADTATVRIEEDGFWNLASGNRSETIGGLEMGESSVATGAGTLTLNGNVSTFFPENDNDYPPATISGRLDLGGATRTFTSTGGGMVVSAAISNGGLTKFGRFNGSYIFLELSGTVANTYTGVTTVADGLLVLNKTAGVNAIPGDLVIGIPASSDAEVQQAGDNQVADTATVTIAKGEWNLSSGNHSETVAALRMTVGIVRLGTGTLTINGNITASRGIFGAPAILASNGQLNLGGATRVFDVGLGSGFAEDLFISAVISNGGLTKIGAGRLTLDKSSSTFTGPLAINGGAVSVLIVHNRGVNSYLGAGQSFALDGGTLEVTAISSSASDRDVMLNAGGGTINVTQAAATVTMSGAFSGAGGLTKTGPGTLTLGGALANDYAGATTVADGTLILTKSPSVKAIGGSLAIGDGTGISASAIVVQGADEQIADSAAITIAADGFWNFASGNHSETIATLAMTGSSIVTGIGTLTVNGNITTNANAASGSISGQLNLGGVTRTFDIAEGTAANDLDITAPISNGVGGLTKTGDGTLRLNGANTFSGPVAINAGTLIARNGSAIGDSSDVTVANGATLIIEGDETIGSLAGGGSVVLGTGSTLTVRGGFTTFSGSISGAGGLVKSDAGIQTFSTAPAYTGNTLITEGTLILNNGIASAAGNLTVNGPGTLQARSTVNRAIAGDGTITATGTLVIGDASSATGFAFNGTFNVGSNIVTLADADVAQLGVATTLGNGGRLDALNGSILASGRSVTVGAAASAIISASFTNNGTVNGPSLTGQSLTFLGAVNGAGNYTGRVLFADGFSPGASAAAVSLENFTFIASTTLSLELGGVLAGSQYDRLNFTGTGLLDGALNVSLIGGFAPQAGQTFTLMQGGTLTGTFDSVSLPVLPAGLHWDTTQLYTTGTISVAPDGLTFTAWATASGIPGALPGGDHDADGWDNATEFALGLFPPQPGTVEPEGGLFTYVEGERLRVLFTRPLDRTGMTLKVQASSDLVVWEDLAVSVNSALFTGPGFVSENRAHPLSEPGLVEVRDILNASAAPRRQIRVRIEIAP